ncbi:hypothetical protein ACA910_021203 [Epithemia clementina (nom. ined.)]
MRNLTLDIAQDSITLSTSLNSEANGDMNSTSNIAGLFDKVIMQTFHANSGNLVTARVAYNPFQDSFLLLDHLPHGKFLILNRFRSFQDFQICCDGHYALFASPYRFGSRCEIGVNLAVNATIVIEKFLVNQKMGCFLTLFQLMVCCQKLYGQLLSEQDRAEFLFIHNIG